METLTASSTLGIDLRFWVAVVTLSGFEPLTCPLGGGCSIQLSHEAVDPSCFFLRHFASGLRKKSTTDEMRMKKGE